ncbi:multidrug ABC transporter [Adlercreutzia sp. R25]|uniref:multidrug ABC transporter n=1 Tax=Adlercreutzia shanghongiae TaxID=3111773 RepID=UPI002DB5C640|nr:multidrug ABC transporter [Adlercreutzia sp. R25]MEC4273286.1 multidrug ABC transporter [Adlercreutzia sp. R25]
MDNSLILYSGILLLGTFVSAVSQVLLKKAALKTYESKIAEYLNFPVIFAYTLFVLTTLMCIVAYRVVPLSFGPVLESTSYLYVTIFGVVIFKEKITAKKAVALGLILIGIVIYATGI